MIGMLKRKAEKVIIDTALKGLKKRVESLSASRAPRRRAHPPVHRQGRRRQDDRRRRHGGPRRAAAGTDPGALHRRGALARRRLRRRPDPPRGAEQPAVEVEPGLFVQQVDAQRRFEQSWAEIQGYLLSVLDAARRRPGRRRGAHRRPGRRGGAGPARAARAGASRGSGTWSSSTARPTAETLRLLALPEALGWYMERVLPAQRGSCRRCARCSPRRPACRCRGDAVFDAVERLHARAREVQALLTGPDASPCGWCSPPRASCWPRRAGPSPRCRCSATRSTGSSPTGSSPSRAVPPERRTATGAPDPWRSAWNRAQQQGLVEVRESFASLPVVCSPYLAHEPIGADALDDAARACTGDVDPDPLRRAPGEGMTVERTGRGFVLRLPLPLVTRRRRRPRAARRRAGRDRGGPPAPAVAARGAAPVRRHRRLGARRQSAGEVRPGREGVAARWLSARKPRTGRPPGTVADEAARLIEALGAWATPASPTAGTATAPRPGDDGQEGAAHGTGPTRPTTTPRRPDAVRRPGHAVRRPGHRRTRRGAGRVRPLRALRRGDRCGPGDLVPGVPRSARASPCCARSGPRRSTGWPTSPAPWPRPCATWPPSGRAPTRRRPPARRPGSAARPVRTNTPGGRSAPRADRLRSRTSRSTTATAPTKETSCEHDGRPGHRRHQDQRRRGRQRRRGDRPRPPRDAGPGRRRDRARGGRPDPRAEPRTGTSSPRASRAPASSTSPGRPCCSRPTSPGATSRSSSAWSRSSTSR